MLGLLIGLITVTAPVSPAILPTITQVVAVQEVEIKQEAELTEEEIIVNKIKEAFGKDAPTMIKIGRCESGLRQEENGKTLVSPTNDYGVFQINDFAHKDKLKELKLDSRKLDDNIKYAQYLFDKEELNPWYMSKHCWDKGM